MGSDCAMGMHEMKRQTVCHQTVCLGGCAWAVGLPAERVQKLIPSPSWIIWLFQFWVEVMSFRLLSPTP